MDVKNEEEKFKLINLRINYLFNLLFSNDYSHRDNEYSDIMVKIKDIQDFINKKFFNFFINFNNYLELSKNFNSLNDDDNESSSSFNKKLELILLFENDMLEYNKQLNLLNEYYNKDFIINDSHFSDHFIKNSSPLLEIKELFNRNFNLLRDFKDRFIKLLLNFNEFVSIIFIYSTLYDLLINPNLR